MEIRNRLEAKRDALMADPRPARPLSTAGLLQSGAWFFERLIRFRNRCYGKGRFKTHRLPCTVISIGNITTGGTGKTPMTLHVAKFLQSLGYKSAILSRGYKGGAEKNGGVVSDGNRLLMTAKAAGDEPLMMARLLENIPVLVGQDRVASGQLAISRFSPDILLLDDGFQHRRLHRDIDIVLLDSTRPFGNRFLLPRGSLREPPDMLDRADAIVFTRWQNGLPEPASLLPESVRLLPVFRSRNTPYIDQRIPSTTGFPRTGKNLDPALLDGTRVFAFSAIANNKDFHRVLSDLGCQTVGTEEFTDHHTYGSRELSHIGRMAGAAGAEVLVTTQKDFPKLPPETVWPLPLVVLGVIPSFVEEENGFDDFLKRSVEKAVNRRSRLSPHG